MGIVSEILPVFSRKPLFGYSVVVFSGIAIGFLGWGVWAHHMFVSGIGPVAHLGVRPLDDAHRGADRREDLQLARHGVGRLGTACDVRCCSRSASSRSSRIGGLSGVMHAIVPADTQQTRHVLRRRALPLRAVRRPRVRGLRRPHYWYPKVFGRMLNETPGQDRLLADGHRVQPHVLPDALPRPRGPAPPHVHVPRRAWAGTR